MAMLVELTSVLYSTVAQFTVMDMKCDKLRRQLEKIDVAEQSLKAKKPYGGKPKRYVTKYFDQLCIYRDKVKKSMDRYNGQGKLGRIWMFSYIDELVEEGEDLVARAESMQRWRLPLYEVCPPGMVLPVENLIGKTVREHYETVLAAIRTRENIIVGIHGNSGSGKTSLLKRAHNSVLDMNGFKAVWATAPGEGQNDVKSIQDCVAKAIGFEFEDEDVVRRSGVLAKQLQDKAGPLPGHVVVFLDNLKQEFLATEVGIPVGGPNNHYSCCTLVFTTSSEDVCNRMRCSRKLKMYLLPEDEAWQLFFHEVSSSSWCTYDHQDVNKVMREVARECDCMPLAIIHISRSMTGKDDICEWRNICNELRGRVGTIIHDYEVKIIACIKFNYARLASNVQKCFLSSAKVLPEGRLLATTDLIRVWIDQGLITSRKPCQEGRNHTTTTSPLIDLGHTIINQLQRAYFLEVIVREHDKMKFVKMNKWIRKMAETEYEGVRAKRRRII